MAKAGSGNYQAYIDKIEKAYPNTYDFIFMNEDNSKKSSRNDKFQIKCKICGNKFDVRLGNIINNIRLGRGHYCPYCSAKKNSERCSLGVDHFKQRLIKKEGSLKYEITGFTTTDAKCTFKCKICDYTFEARPSNVFNSKVHYCPKCNNMVRDERPYPERVKDIHKTIFPMEDYIDRKTKILHKCTKCNNTWKAIPTNILKGEGCPTCRKSAYTSKGETEVYEFIKSIYDGDVQNNNRSIISPAEIDIYIPEFKLAIEYCGLYWHGERNKPNDYHINKTNSCAEQGVRLIHIFEDEWLHKNKIVKNKLKYILHCSDKPKIYARNCYIKEINIDKKDRFLTKYHLQGKDVCQIKLGLFTKDTRKLISVMTFCKPRRALGHKSSSSYDYELSRFASSYNYIVVGAFSKLFSYFKNKYEWNTLITYADKRWSVGDVYLKNGWVYDHDSKPSYSYVFNSKGTIRYHRYNYSKSKLKTLLPEYYDENKTEHEIMQKADYYRIYDCGNLVFKYQR